MTADPSRTVRPFTSRVVRQEAPPQEHAHVHPPIELRWTRGWWLLLARMPGRLFTVPL